MTEPPRDRPTGQHMKVVETGDIPVIRDLLTESEVVPSRSMLPLGHTEVDQLGRRFDFFKAEVRSDLERIFLHLKSIPTIEHDFAELQRFTVASNKLLHERIDGVDVRLMGVDTKLAEVLTLLRQLADVR